MTGDSKTSFDLEPNPFEKSFATKESSIPNGSSISEHKDDASGKSLSNKHDLHIPNLSSLNQPNGKLPGITPPMFTPGGRRLPPLGLSSGGHLSNPGTPGSNLWNSLLSATNNNSNNNATNNDINDNSHHPNSVQPFQHNQTNNHNNYHQFVNTLRKTGLTPNESNLRSGPVPGNINHTAFPFGSQVPGLTTPNAFLNSPIIPGLPNLLSMNSTTTSAQSHNQAPPNTSANSSELNNYQTLNQPIQQISQPEQSKESEIPNKNTNKRKNSIVNDRVKKPKINSANRGKKWDSKKESESKAEESKNNNKFNKKTKPIADDEKRKNFLERNRVAASKCRQRKKLLMQKMEDELAFYSTGYRELSAQVTQLRDQLVNLKGIIVGHKDCPILLSSVGGFDQLNNIIQQVNYVTQLTVRSQTNVTSIPSTIPTTLNSTHEDTLNPGFPPPAPTTTIAPNLPLQLSNGTNKEPSHHSSNNNTTNPSTETLSNSNINYSSHNQQQPQQSHQNSTLSSHHSLTDLPAAASAAGLNAHETHTGNGDLRPIHSMSNLAAMNSSTNRHQVQSNNLNGNFNIRPVNSMIDLQHYQQQAQSQAQAQAQAQAQHQQQHQPLQNNYGSGINILGLAPQQT